MLPSARLDVLVADAELERLAHELRVADHHAHGRRADPLDAAGDARAGVVAHLDLQRAVAALGVDARVEVLGELDALSGGDRARVDRVGRRAVAVGDRVRRVWRDGQLVLGVLAEVGRQRAAGLCALGLGVRAQLQRGGDRQVLPRAAVRVQRRRRALDLQLTAGLHRDAVAALRLALRGIALVVAARDRDRAGERQDQERVVVQRRPFEVTVPPPGVVGPAGGRCLAVGPDDLADGDLDPARDLRGGVGREQRAR